MLNQRLLNEFLLNSPLDEQELRKLSLYDAPFRSYLTQQMLNYFDAADMRTRQHPNSLEAQLFNSLAMVMEQSDERIRRETEACSFVTVPLNLDNGGLWYSLALPASAPDPSAVAAFIDGSWVPLRPYDDRFPVPAALDIDPSRATVPCTSIVLFEATGSGVPQQFGPITLPLANTLTFELSNTLDAVGDVQVEITGAKHPRLLWADSTADAVERIRLTSEGVVSSTTVWSSISSVRVNRLPEGARLRCLLLPIGISEVPDPARPYTHYADRDVLYTRVWNLRGSVLYESFRLNNRAGLQTIQSYVTPTAMQGVVLEPNTPGMILWDSEALYYADRREPLPNLLDRTALTTEPLYGLSVAYDESLSTDTLRRVTLTPTPYARSGRMAEYRYSVEYPDGTVAVLLPDGTTYSLSGSAGWRQSRPEPVSFAVSIPGTYVFTLECLDTDGAITSDVQVYANLVLQPLGTFNLFDKVLEVKGAAFDSLQRLWVWTGDLLVPMRFAYHSYVYDRDARTLYFTENHERVRIA